MGCLVDQINVGDKDILFFYLFPSFFSRFLASGIARIRVVSKTNPNISALFFRLISGMNFISLVGHLEQKLTEGMYI